VFMHPTDSELAAREVGLGAGRWGNGWQFFRTVVGPLAVTDNPDVPPGTYWIPPSQLKHGPRESGDSGPCEFDCKKCAAEMRLAAVNAVSKRVEHTLKQLYQDRVLSTAEMGKMASDAAEYVRGATKRPVVPLDPRKLAAVNAGLRSLVKPLDPLDVEYDGLTLRELLTCDELQRREYLSPPPRRSWTPAQRAAVSAHWSAQLRAKVAATAELERNRVLVDLQDEP